MRCHICNAALSPPEVQWNNQHNDWDPCGRCLAVIDEVFSDKTEEEIDEEIAFMLYEDEPEDQEEDADEDVLE